MGATLRSRLPQVAAELRPRVSAAIKEGAEEIAEEARERVPVSDTAPHLRDRISVRRSGPAQYEVVAGDGELFYGHFLEHGTEKMEAQPFLEPAADAHESEVTDAVIAVLRGL